MKKLSDYSIDNQTNELLKCILGEKDFKKIKIQTYKFTGNKTFEIVVCQSKIVDKDSLFERKLKDMTIGFRCSYTLPGYRKLHEIMHQLISHLNN